MSSRMKHQSATRKLRNDNDKPSSREAVSWQSRPRRLQVASDVSCRGRRLYYSLYKPAILLLKAVNELYIAFCHSIILVRGLLARTILKMRTAIFALCYISKDSYMCLCLLIVFTQWYQALYVYKLDRHPRLFHSRIWHMQPV